MIDTISDERCSADQLADLVIAIDENASRGVELLERMLADYPRDARLYFVKGAMLASWHENELAINEMLRAIELAPQYWLARFYLGLLYFSTGSPEAAENEWLALGHLPREHYLRLFAEGLRHDRRGELGEAGRLLSQGIRNNREYVPLNRDMKLIVFDISVRRLRASAAKPFQWLKSRRKSTQ